MWTIYTGNRIFPVDFQFFSGKEEARIRRTGENGQDGQDGQDGRRRHGIGCVHYVHYVHHVHGLWKNHHFELDILKNKFSLNLMFQRSNLLFLKFLI